MNILYLTQLFPYPLDAGGKIKTFSTLKALSANHKIHLVSFVDHPRDSRHAKLLKRKLKLAKVGTITNPLVVEKNFRQQLSVMAKSFLSQMPYSMYKFSHPAMIRHIRQLIQNNAFDILWIDHLSMAQYLPRNFSGIKILESHNVESILYHRHAEHEQRKIWQLFFYLESFKYARIQKKILPKFNHIFAISKTDQSGLKSFVSGSKPPSLSVLSPAVSPDFLAVKPKFKSPTILFVGLLTWYPNKTGIIWFVKKVFPLIQKQIPKAKLLLVGDKSKRFPLRSTKNILFTGYVTSVLPYFRQASVFIVPIHFGSGIRIKILQAMATGLPIVSTTIGAEGIYTKSKQGISITNSSQEFAKQVIKKISNRRKSKRFTSSIKKLIKENYSQKTIRLQLEKNLKYLVKNHHTIPPHFQND